VLLRTVEVVMEDLPLIRSGFSENAWRSLALPGARPTP
jgi:hypothetical protein